MIKAPRGHTSIYLSEHIKNNIDVLRRVMHERGFTSFNSFMNVLLTDTMNSHVDDDIPKLNVFSDNPSVFKEKTKVYSDGELYDIYKTISEKRDIVFRELKKRGVGT